MMFVRTLRRLAVAFAVCAALLAVAPQALAAPGPVGGLASATHPDPTRWYPNSSPSFSWQPAVGALGYASLIDHNATTDPR